MKNILQGNEAIAREAWEAVLVGTFSKLFPEIEDRMWLNALTDLLPKRFTSSMSRHSKKGGRLNSTHGMIRSSATR